MTPQEIQKEIWAGLVAFRKEFTFSIAIQLMACILILELLILGVMIVLSQSANHRRPTPPPTQPKPDAYGQYLVINSSQNHGNPAATCELSFYADHPLRQLFAYTFKIFITATSIGKLDDIVFIWDWAASNPASISEETPPFA